METRVCKKCGEDKELKSYYTYKRKGNLLYKGTCKQCSIKEAKERNKLEFRESMDAERLLNQRGYKTCKICKEVKELSFFAKGRRMCKPCYRTYQNKHNYIYKKNNAYKVKDYNKKYNARKWIEDNAEKIAERKAIKKREKETKLRVCKICGDEKSLNDFPKNGISSSENQLWQKRCILCSNTAIQKWRVDNYEERFAYRKRYYQENEVKIKKRKKNHYNNNPDKRKEYYEANRESINKRVVEKRKNDPVLALAHNLRSRTAHAFSQRGYTKRSKTYIYLGLTFEDLKEYIGELFEEGMSWNNREEWHIDHTIPLASVKSENELIALCHYMNLQPMWSYNNMSKSDSYNPEDKRKYLEWYSANVKKLDLK